MMKLRLVKRKYAWELRGNREADQCGEGRIYLYKVLK